MNWKGLLSAWSGPKINRIRALLVKEWLVYADQKFYLLAGLAFQIILAAAFIGLARFFPTGAAGHFHHFFLVMLVLVIFSSVSGFLPGRLLEELENKNLTACLLTPATFFEWVLAAGIFALAVNTIYLIFLLGAGMLVYRLSLAGGLVMAVLLGLIILVVFALGLLLAVVTLVLKKGYIIYTWLETGIILLLALLIPSGALNGWSVLLKLTPHYLVFQGLRLGFGGRLTELMKYLFYLGLAAALLWPAGIFLLNKAFNYSRKQAVF